jgi:hypothetical protein
MSFDKGSLSFSRTYDKSYVNQGWLEALRKEDPEKYKFYVDRHKDADDPEDLAIEIGKCSPL